MHWVEGLKGDEEDVTHRPDYGAARLHGIIAREAGSRRYHFTREAIRMCLLQTNVSHRISGLDALGWDEWLSEKARGCVITVVMNQLDNVIDQIITQVEITA